MKVLVKNLLMNMPYIGRALKENEILKANLKEMAMWKPPGHFYSPIPSLDEVKKDADRIFAENVSAIPGIDINESGQLEILEQFRDYYQDIPFQAEKNEQHRYYYNNPYYSYADGISLYCMMLHLRPKNVIEVGSGFSSALMLDVNDLFFDSSINFTFIEPYPDRLRSLLQEQDHKHTTIHSQRIQDLPLRLFEELGPGDILFVDSSHVSKTGSDVNFIFFEILPRLKQGVYIHVHDIFFPFEYPKNWVYEGVSWSEAYLLRAFLQYNNIFAIEFFVSYLLTEHRDRIINTIPLAVESEKTEISFYKDAPGANIWLQKLQ